MVFLLRIILCFPCSSLSGPETINTSLNPPRKRSLPEQGSNSHYIFQTWRGVTISLRLTSCQLITFWWCSFLRILISWMGRDRELAPNSREMRAVNQYVFQNASKGILTPSRSLSMRIFLTATFPSSRSPSPRILAWHQSQQKANQWGRLAGLMRRQRARVIGEIRGVSRDAYR